MSGESESSGCQRWFNGSGSGVGGRSYAAAHDALLLRSNFIVRVKGRAVGKTGQTLRIVRDTRFRESSTSKIVTSDSGEAFSKDT